MQSVEISYKERSGPLENSRPDFLVIAKIFKPHGLKGEVSAELLTDFPKQLVPGREVYIGKEHMRVRIHTVRKVNKRYLLSFQGIESRDLVEIFRNKIMYTTFSGLPNLPEGEFYHHDLIGLHVFNENNEELGILSEIIRTGANDVYIITTKNKDLKEILIPAIKSVVKKIDIEKKRMLVKLPEWK